MMLWLGENIYIRVNWSSTVWVEEMSFAKQQVSLTITSYDESSFEPAENGERRTGSC